MWGVTSARWRGFACCLNISHFVRAAVVLLLRIQREAVRYNMTGRQSAHKQERTVYEALEACQGNLKYKSWTHALSSDVRCNKKQRAHDITLTANLKQQPQFISHD